MWYLITSLFWWLLAALALGLFVGWSSCRKEPRKQGLGWLGLGIVAFIIGLIIAFFKLLPGKAGLWLDEALLFFAAFIIGCCIGCLFGRRPAAEVAKPAVAAATTVAAVAAAPKAPAGPAMVRPYQWQAAKDASSVTLTGYVPSDESRGRIVATAKSTLAPAAIIDKMQLGAGAPAGSEGMISTAFGHLAKLDKGIASLIDTKYTLTGVAGTQPNYNGVMTGVRALPTGYSLAKVDIVAPPMPKPAPAPVAAVPKPAAPKPAPKPVAVKAPAPKPAPKPAAPKYELAPKIAGEDKVPGKRPMGYLKPRDGKADDLKLINGVGKQNEGRMHGLGIWHFDQVAAWTPQESLWVGSYLAFPGRIEREDWVGQCKLLAAGKMTDHAKRAKAGKIATSTDDGTKGQANILTVAPMRKVKGTAPAKAKAPAKPKK
jgi:predicted flap endonuclease-1-like 5' DNA nuclease